MGLPKKKKPITNLDKISRSLKQAGFNGPVETETKPEEKKRVGRKPLAGDRSSKITFYVSKETAERYDLAFMQEQLKQAQKGIKIDKSLLIENVLKDWLKKNKY